MSSALPHAREEPPWSCNGDPAAADFGTLYAYPAYEGWSLYYDRAQRRFAFSTKAEVRDEVVHAGRRWDVVRLSAAEERELRRTEAAASASSDWVARALNEARLRASASIEHLAAEQLEAFSRGAVLAAIDQAVAALRQAQQAHGHANDVDAQLYAEACDRLSEMRLALLRLAPAYARLCAEREHVEAQDALAELESDLMDEQAA